MAHPVYYVPAGDVLPIFFDTFDGGTGASITLSGLAVTDIEIYKDGSVTQRSSDAGYTLLDTDGIDFDGVTGIHGFSIDTGNNTDAGFYTVGSWFHVVVSSVTVDAQTVNFVAAAFRLMPAEDAAGVPDVNVTHWLGTAPATPTTAGVPEVDVTHVAGTAQSAGDLSAKLDTIDNFLDTEVAAILEDTGTTLPATLSTIAGYIDTEVAAIVSTLGTPAGASVSADIAAVKAETASILTDTAEIGAAGAGLTALATQASVDTIDTNVDAILVDTGTTLDGKLDTIDDLLDTEIAAIKSDTAAILADTGTDGVVLANGAITTAKFGAGAIDAAAVAADVSTEIVAALAATALSGLTSAGTWGDAIRRMALGARGLVTFTVGASATTTSVPTNLTEATDDHYNGRTVVFTSGALIGQAVSISDYNGTTKTLTVSAATESPAENDIGVIV